MNPIFPQDTRNGAKTTQRDAMNFPQSLPAVAHNPLSVTSSPIYDRNIFSMGMNNGNIRHIESNRLMESSEFYTSSNPVMFDGMLDQTREKRYEKRSLDERRNMDRFFMTQRNYNKEVGDRINGFNMIARDTRFDNTKKTGISKEMEMRGNRTIGAPFGKDY